MFADAFAGIAADKAVLSVVETDPVMFRFEHIRSIQLRLLAIATDIATNFPREKTDRPPKEPRALATTIASSHALQRVGGHWLCMRCGWFPSLRRLREAWLAAPGRFVSGVSDVAAPFVRPPPSAIPLPPGARFQCGKVRLAPSHRLLLLAGVYICGKCGCFAARRVEKLGSYCRGFATVAGEQVLKRLSLGLLPRNTRPVVRSLDLIDLDS